MKREGEKKGKGIEGEEVRRVEGGREGGRRKMERKRIDKGGGS